MTYWELTQTVKSFYPAIALDNTFPRALRERTFTLLWILSLLSGVTGSLSLLPAVEDFLTSLFIQAPLIIHLGAGVCFLLLPFATLVFMLNSFINSFYFRGFDHVQVLAERSPSDKPRVSFEVAAFCFGADTRDITGAFLRFSYGQLMLVRAGLEAIELQQFLAHRTTQLSSEQFTVTPASSDALRVFDLAMAVFHQDKELADFLFKRGVQEKNLLEAAQWVSRDMLAYKKHVRWWSRDNLGRIEGIGTDWSYGTAFRLKRYAHELTADRLAPFSSKPSYIKNDEWRLEASLSKAREANAILVGEDGGSKMEVLRAFGARVQDGSVFPALVHKKVYLFNASRLISDAGEKTKFEHEFIKLLDEVAAAGNCIMVIEDFPAFIESVSHIGSSAVGLVSPYLDGSAIQFICLSSPTPFHQVIEPDGILLAKFDTIILEAGESADLTQTLRDAASGIEAQQGISIPQPTLTLNGVKFSE